MINPNLKLKVLPFIVFMCVSLLLSQKSFSQFYLQMRGGWQSGAKRALIAPAVSFSTHGFNITPELVIYPNNDAPVHLGGRLSYTFKFIEAGYGRYYEMYSTDKYDRYKNGWINIPFVAAHWKTCFVEYGYHHGGVFSIGIRERISRKSEAHIYPY